MQEYVKKARRRNYGVQFRLCESVKEAGHRLSLAMTDEEDAERWKVYKDRIDTLQRMEGRIGYSGIYSITYKRTYYKPIFDDTYVAYTRELITLYDELANAEDGQHRQIKKKIRDVRQKRREAAQYVMRDTGEIAEEFTP